MVPGGADIERGPHYFLSLIRLFSCSWYHHRCIVGMVIGSIVVDWLAQYDQIAEIHVPQDLPLPFFWFPVALVLGEFVPKQYAANRLKRCRSALFHSPVFRKNSLSIYWGAGCYNRLLIRTMRITTHKATITEGNQADFAGGRRRAFWRREHELVTSVFRFADRRVSSIMTPRSDIVWLNTGTDGKKYQKDSGIRAFPVPVCDGNLDLVVVLSMRDIYNQLTQQQPVILTQFSQAIVCGGACQRSATQ